MLQAERITLFLLHTMEATDSPVVRSGLCLGLSKLLLSGLVTDPRVGRLDSEIPTLTYAMQVLTSLAVNYVSPVNADNQELRQCLSYFFPVYSYASATNQNRVRLVWYDLLWVSHPSNRPLGFLASIRNRFPLA